MQYNFEGLLPIPLQNFLPINLKAAGIDSRLLAFCEKFNYWFLKVASEAADLRYIGTVERTPNNFLPSLGDLLFAYFDELTTDSDRTKRQKLLAAIPRHKVRGTFSQDIKPKIDSIAGGSCYIYANGFQSNDNYDFLYMSGDSGEGYNDYDFSLLDSGDEEYGMILLAGSDSFFEVPGNVFIDTDNTLLSEQDIEDIKALLHDSIACYVRVFLGYISTSWSAVTDSSFGTDAIRDVTHNGSDLWVAVGILGKLATSPDGETWTQRTSSFGSTTINSVAHNGVDLWVAVGQAGKIATSPDGINWTQRSNPMSGIINAVAYGNGLWVAVAVSGGLATSPDGITWTSRTSSFGTTDIYTVAYGGGLWVAIGAATKAATSSDGINWSPYFAPWAYDKIAHNGVDLWVAVGSSGHLGTTPDGTTWTERTSSFGSTDINGVAYGKTSSSWTAVGSLGKLAESPNGINWAQKGSSFGSTTIRSVAYNIEDQVWVAVGESGKMAIAKETFNFYSNGQIN